MELTDAGKLFYDDIRKMFDELHRSIKKAQRTQNGEIGSLTIGGQLPAASMAISWRQNDPSPLVNTFIKMAKEMG